MITIDISLINGEMVLLSWVSISVFGSLWSTLMKLEVVPSGGSAPIIMILLFLRKSIEMESSSLFILTTE